VKIWEQISERVRDLPPEQQRQVLDYVDFLRARGASVPAPGPGAGTSWPGVRFAAEESPRVRDADRPSSMDDFLAPPPRRRAGPILLGVALALAVLAVGGFLYYRYVESAPGPSDEAVAPAAAPADAALAAATTRPTGAEVPASPDATFADVPAPDAAPPAVPPLRLTLGGSTDAAVAATPDVPVEPGAETAPPARAPTAGTPTVTPPPAIGVACAAALDEARGLWRRGRRDEALQKLREAIACDPENLEPRLQWGRWFVDSAAAPRNREAVAEGAAMLRPAAEANPHHGELWFHYTNLLFGSRQREAAQAAREHCMAIRPADEYSASCRFLPQ